MDLLPLIGQSALETIAAVMEIENDLQIVGENLSRKGAVTSNTMGAVVGPSKVLEKEEVLTNVCMTKPFTKIRTFTGVPKLKANPEEKQRPPSAFTSGR